MKSPCPIRENDMKKGEIFTGRVTGIRFPNKGIVETQDGQSFMVKNALPGQIVEAKLTKKRNGQGEGLLLRVLEKAPDERESPCPVFGRCGGCLYLTLPYERELHIKEEQVKGLLQQAIDGSGTETDSVDSFWEPAHASPVTEGYRNKMEFTFGDSCKGGPLTLGMHRRGSFYDLADASCCAIVDGDYRAIVRAACDFFAKRQIPYFHRVRHDGYLRHLLVRKGAHTGEILIDLVTTSHTEEFYCENPETVSILRDREKAAGHAEQAAGDRKDTMNAFTGSEEELLHAFTDCLLGLKLDGNITGILHTVNDSAADIIEDQGTQTLYGRAYFEEQILGLKFLVTPFSFFQTNSYGAELLYTIARDYIAGTGEMTKKPVVFDLYCGTGTISQLVAPSASKVVGVEIVEEAVEAAKQNAVRNGIANCEFLAGDVLKVLDTVQEKPDLIILDPPRDGVHPKALPKILAYGVSYILYISCKPTSLARDLPAFLAAGYRPVRATCLDQFPWTSGVETLIMMQRQN